MPEGHTISQHDPDSSAGAALTAEQFEELKALLQPGFELATLMLADYKAAHQPAAADDQAETKDPQ